MGRDHDGQFEWVNAWAESAAKTEPAVMAGPVAEPAVEVESEPEISDSETVNETEKTEQEITEHHRKTEPWEYEHTKQERY